MILSECISLIRQRVNDGDSRYWSDIEVTNEINLWAGDLFRQMADAHESYGLMRYVILNTDTERVFQIKRNIFNYELPSWAWRVHRVHVVEGNTDTVDGREGQRLPYIPTGAQGFGWNFAGTRSLRVQGFTEAKTLAVWMQKIPSRAFPGIVSANSAAQNELKFDLNVVDGDGNAYSIDREQDAYLGASFEMTSFVGARDPRGSVLRVESAAKAFTTVWEMTVTGRPQFPALPEAADTFEVHVPIPNQHLLYLVLRVCESLHQKSKNSDAIAALQAQLGFEHVRFIEALQPRTAGVTHMSRDPDDLPYYTDPDRDPQFPTY